MKITMYMMTGVSNSVLWVQSQLMRHVNQFQKEIATLHNYMLKLMRHLDIVVIKNNVLTSTILKKQFVHLSAEMIIMQMVTNVYQYMIIRLNVLEIRIQMIYSNN